MVQPVPIKAILQSAKAAAMHMENCLEYFFGYYFFRCAFLCGYDSRVAFFLWKANDGWIRYRISLISS